MEGFVFQVASHFPLGTKTTVALAGPGTALPLISSQLSAKTVPTARGCSGAELVLGAGSGEWWA